MLEMIQHYETQMAAIGARLLARPAAGAEAAETVRLKSLADTSLLVLASVECSNVLTWALKMHEALAGRPSDDTDVSLDRNFHTANLTAQDLAAIVKAWQDGALSAEDVARDLKMGGYIDPSRDLADVTAEIEAARGEQDARRAAMMEQYGRAVRSAPGEGDDGSSSTATD